MTQKQSPSDRSPGKKIIFWVVVGVSIPIALGALLLICLPMIISSSWTKEMVCKQASQALDHPVRIEDMAFTWTKGLKLRGFRFSTNLNSENILALNQLTIQPHWRTLLKKKFFVDIELDGLDLSFVREQSGHTNWDFLLNTQKDKPSPQKPSQPLIPESIECKLPIDVGCHIRMDELSCQVIDLTTDNQLTLDDASLFIGMPSLHYKPIMAQVRAKGSMNKNPLPPLEVDLDVRNLMDPQGYIDPRTITLHLLARVPGTNIDIRGGMNQEGISGQIDIKPSVLLTAVRPLISAPLPEIDGSIHITTTAVASSKKEFLAKLVVNATDLFVSGNDYPGLSGSMGLSLQGHGNPEKHLSLRMRCQGTDLRVRTPQQQVGPIQCTISQNGTYSLSEGSLEIVSGSLTLQDHNSLHWKGQISSLLETVPHIDFRMTKAGFDLRELLILGRPFLSKDIDFAFQNNLPAILQIKDLRIFGEPPSGEQDISLKLVKMTLPPLTLRTNETTVGSRQCILSVHNATIRMQSAFPTAVKATIDLQTDDIQVSSFQKASIEHIGISELHLLADKLSPQQNSLLGLTGSFRISHKAFIKGFEIQNTAGISRIDHQLNLALQVKNASSCRVDLLDFQMTSPEITVRTKEGKTVKTNLSLLSNGRLKCDLSNPQNTDVENLRLETTLGQSVNLETKVKAQKLGAKGLQTEGNIHLDLGALLPLLAEYFPSAHRLSGTTKTEWSFSGRTPLQQEIQTLMTESTSLRQYIEKLNFFKYLKVKTSLRDVALQWPEREKGMLRVQGISTTLPVSLSLDNNLRHIEFSGSLAIKEIQGSPTLKDLDSPLGLSLDLNGSLHNMDVFRFSEQLRLRPLPVTQTAQVKIDNISSLLEQDLNTFLPAALSRLQANISGNLQADFGQPAQNLGFGLAVGNAIQAGLFAELVGGERIAFDFNMTSPGLEVTIQDMGTINGFGSHLHLSKIYQVRQSHGEKTKMYGKYPQLSLRVLTPPEQKNPLLPDSRKLERQKTPYWAQDLGHQPDLSLTRIQLMALPLPLDISHLSLETRQHQGIPGIENFQLDLWSGTLVGKARILPRDSGFGLDLACSFSGLDATAALPGRLQPQRDATTQLSGRILLETPLKNQLKSMLQELNLTLDLTHIGSQTLQQFLYAMDPTGNNEAIVRQRKLLESGRPKLIQLAVEQGNLSLTGTVEVKGIKIQLPPIKRFQISELPLQDQFSNVNIPLNTILNLLHIVAAQGIMITSDNSIQWIGARP